MGHKQTLEQVSRDVRFAPKSRHTCPGNNVRASDVHALPLTADINRLAGSVHYAARPGPAASRIADPSSDLANEPTHGELPACVLSQSVDGFLQGDCGVVALSVVPV